MHAGGLSRLAGGIGGQAMRRRSGWMLTGVVCLAVAASIAARDHDEQDQRGNPPAAGKGRVLLPLPDLTVTGEFKPKVPCDNGTLALATTAKIKNQGEGPAVLVSNWTKPWVTAYLSVSLPGFVKPYQTGCENCHVDAGRTDGRRVQHDPAAGAERRVSLSSSRWIRPTQSRRTTRRTTRTWFPLTRNCG